MKKKFLFILIFSISVLTLGCTEQDEVLLKDEIEDEVLLKDEVEDEKEILKVNLLATGDMMFHSPQFRAAYDIDTGIYDFSPSFKYVENYVDDADISIANFETVTAGSDIEYSGFPRFNTPEESVKAISEAGFDILVTANNHSLDQGKTGLINTIKTVDKYNMKNIGTYIDMENPILVEEVNGIKLGFLSYTYGFNGLDSELTEDELSYMVNKIDEEMIKSDIEEAKRLKLDTIVIYIHWGNEYQSEANEHQIRLAREMLNWGADIILGSHPHVIQESEMLNIDGKDKFIIYSMGNFLSNQSESSMGNQYTEDGIMVNLEITKDEISNETKINKVEYIPTWVYRYREDDKLKYEILPISDILNGGIDIEISDDIKMRIEESFEDTMRKISD